MAGRRRQRSRRDRRLAGHDAADGRLVNEITRHPLHAEGVAAGDVILAVAGHTIDDPQALKYRIATCRRQTADLTSGGVAANVSHAEADRAHEDPRAT